MKYRVRLTEKAEQDADGVLAWFAAQSAQATGQRWLSRLVRMIDKLETMPQRCALSAEAEAVGVELREMRFGKRQRTYRVLFVIRGSTVHILRIWHCARDSVKRGDLE